MSHRTFSTEFYASAKTGNEYRLQYFHVVSLFFRKPLLEVVDLVLSFFAFPDQLIQKFDDQLTIFALRRAQNVDQG